MGLLSILNAFFRNFFAKSFVISNNNFIFAATYSPRFPLEQRAQGESFFCMLMNKIAYPKEQKSFDALLVQTIDATLGLRCTLYGYQYSEILRFLMCVYLCGGKERIYDDMNETSKMD